MLNGLIAQKLQYLDQVLTELRSLGQVDGFQLQKDWRTRRAIERDLHILGEIVVDVCQYLISIADQAPAVAGADAIGQCIQLGALSENQAYQDMIQIRSLFVQRREQIDVDVLISIVNHRLPDFETFRDEVLAFAHSR